MCLPECAGSGGSCPTRRWPGGPAQQEGSADPRGPALLPAAWRGQGICEAPGSGALGGALQKPWEGGAA